MVMEIDDPGFCPEEAVGLNLLRIDAAFRRSPQKQRLLALGTLCSAESVLGADLFR